MGIATHCIYMSITAAQKLNIRPLVDRVLGGIPSRNRDIVRARFSIGRQNKETLESIGRRYNITRERVRQIEEASLAKMKGLPEFESLDPISEHVISFIDERGGMMREDELLRELVPSAQKAHLQLVLHLGHPFTLMRETNNFHTVWTTDKEKTKQFQAVLAQVVSHLDKKNSPVSWDDLLNVAKEESEKSTHSFPPDILARHIPVSKLIAQGPFERFGLAHWPEINPRGVRDKAYLVFESKNKPLHFREIAKYIDTFNFPRRGRSKSTHPQTVHNELIKDPRFVLVGRGIYALGKWGYKAGTVREVLVSILGDAKKKPLSKKELVALVSEQRLVQENTILLNLQNKKYFSRTKEGRYTLA